MRSGKEAAKVNTAIDRELTYLACIADESLLDLLLEDGLISVSEQKRAAAPHDLLSLLRRVFATAQTAPRTRTQAAPRAHEERSDATFALRAPPLAA